MAAKKSNLVAFPDRRDIDLVRRARAGEREAFRQIVERSRATIWRMAMRMTGNSEAAEDITQDAFARAFERLDEFREGSEISTWIYAIARNRCLDELRARRPQDLLEDHVLVDPAPSPERGARLREAGTRLETLLMELSASHREAFLLRHMEGLEYEEIAGRMKTTIENVKVRVHRARVALANRLGDDDGSE